METGWYIRLDPVVGATLLDVLGQGPDDRVIGVDLAAVEQPGQAVRLILRLEIQMRQVEWREPRHLVHHLGNLLHHRQPRYRDNVRYLLGGWLAILANYDLAL